MKLIAHMALVSLLCGCASYSERQAQAPWFTLASDRSPKEVERCLAPKLRDIAPRVTGGPDGEAQVYSFVADPAVLGTVTISPDSDGSKVEIRSVVRGGVFKKAAAAAESCR
ncbi:hypothetical protein [Xanthomonas arboricola]|uniref:hypothetical protein n=1 Tax=Xanthomonas arboricola TaxID=56448 RepID=UPI000CEF3DC9|nr:hypothetical protein [Xanthomonas arboricola]PPT49408.1 hypothetical protein XarbCFBP8147_13125 [Xanthomonas arboricola]